MTRECRSESCGTATMLLIKRDQDKGYLDSLLWVPKKHINVEGVKSALTFQANDSRKFRSLILYEETADHLLVPREFWNIKDLHFPVVDARPRSFPKTQIRSKIILDAKSPTQTTQRDAVKAMQQSPGGILQLACGKGKTVCALELISREATPALIIVDNTHLLGQWKEAVEQFLEFDGGLGIIGDGQFDWKKSVVISTYQTLAQRAQEFPQEARRWFGLIIWDEAHHMAAPTWAKTADLFYGKRIGLTATPERPDGTHVIYDFHIGKVLYKDLVQELKPAIYFYWTGLEVDISDTTVREKVCDVNGELHISMLYSYFGGWKPRLNLILDEVRKAEKQGRKVLVLSYSIAELVNMFSLWGAGSTNELYTDIAYPTAQDVSMAVPPQRLDDRSIKRLMIRKRELENAFNKVPAHGITLQLNEIANKFQAHECWKKCELEYERRQLAYVRAALKQNSSNAGLMIGAIKPAERQKMLREKQVVFAIMKYGREGLDEQSLDTVFVCEPMSQKNALQQLMGRVLRKKPGKKTPIVVFFEDNVGPVLGMCRNLRSHLRTWPIEEGGPFPYDLVNHPRKEARKTWATL
jgi:superfamily II DNA or RNA helicase